jgi:hypothetical protein
MGLRPPGRDMAEFFNKNPEKCLTELKEELYARLESRKNYAAQEPLKDLYFKGLQKGALSEVEYLEALLDRLERS